MLTHDDKNHGENNDPREDIMMPNMRIPESTHLIGCLANVLITLRPRRMQKRVSPSFWHQNRQIHTARSIPNLKPGIHIVVEGR